MATLLQGLTQEPHVLGHEVLAQRFSRPGLDQGGEVVLALHFDRDHGCRHPRLDVVDDALEVALGLASMAHSGVAISLPPQLVFELLRSRLEGVGARRTVAQ